MYPPKTGDAAMWRDKIAEHISRPPRGTKELNQYMAKREAAMERRMACNECDKRIENARKLLAQSRAERDEEGAEEEAREEGNRFRREEDERRKGKKEEQVPKQDHQTREVALTHSYVEELTEVNDSVFDSHPCADLSQHENVQFSNWA
jgi:hypothetical protein